jgi:DNA ligase (NAD+)
LKNIAFNGLWAKEMRMSDRGDMSVPKIGVMSVQDARGQGGDGAEFHSADAERIAQQLLQWKRAYYRGESTVPDGVYDALEDRLRSVAPHHPVLDLVGADFAVRASAPKVPHEPPMLSLAKSYTSDEVAAFVARFDAVCVTDKLDGMALALEYSAEGKLLRASTRGNGRTGEDVTAHVLRIPFIPKTLCLPFESSVSVGLEVRGEVFFPLAHFERFRQRFDSFRNAVPGSFGRKDPDEAADVLQTFRFCAYDCILKRLSFQRDGHTVSLPTAGAALSPKEVSELLGLANTSHLEKLRVLESLGFWAGVSEGSSFLLPGLAAAELGPFLKSVLARERSYAIDGLVLRCDDDSTWDELGYTSHHPRASLAFKQQGESAVTRIEEILIGVGRSGKVSFRARLVPVSLSGATLSFATLHNAEFVDSGGYAPGAVVRLKRSGEVIPYIIGVEQPAPVPFPLPKRCLCGSPLTRHGPDLYCLDNPSCPYRDSESILHFVRSLEIYGVSEKVLERFREAGLLERPGDLFRITETDLMGLDGFGEKSARNVVSAIAEKRKLSLSVFLTALGLKRGGKVKCEEVAKRYGHLETVRQLSAADLAQLKGWAEKSAEDFVSSLREKSALIDELLHWIEVEEAVIGSDPVGAPLFGKKICITGSLSRPRSFYEGVIKEQRGQTMSAVTTATDFLVCNEASGSAKYQKARALGIPILSEQEFMDLAQTRS